MVWRCLYGTHAIIYGNQKALVEASGKEKQKGAIFFLATTIFAYDS
jgi:hypothetical protein